ncbi:helix-turn-helix transcriptional regulator [Nocardioides humilatus]|uniref:Helix-turn-helix transcriptional regulator n=1 Tax=Nocardioides humilatus TaxID=2607660 RepID=A0A5B1LDR4_9ACTN|nr:helix-turn-helix domain-containing protein [Nocardioides humilatus]KAA1418873.1 helix-turn-helix transcriptional regulator [Nocardioides humilatus]
MGDEEISSLRAAAHPLRLRMLSLLTASAMSAAEVARELDVTHANASYHLRLLHDAGLIIVEGEERIRGGVAKRYRYSIDHPEPKPSTTDLEGDVRAMSSELLRRIVHRKPGRGNFTDAELWVSEETWQQALELVTQGSRLIHEQAQKPRTAGTILVNLSVAAFEMEQS